MLTFKEYTRAIDIWSVGCILAEMLSGKPLFPGRDYHHQLSLILDILGTPSLDDFYAISSPRSREYIRVMPFRKRKPFSTLFPKANPLAIDLMEKCLTFSPKKRIQVDEALKHPYLEVRPAASSASGHCSCFVFGSHITTRWTNRLRLPSILPSSTSTMAYHCRRRS